MEVRALNGCLLQKYRARIDEKQTTTSRSLTSFHLILSALFLFFSRVSHVASPRLRPAIVSPCATSRSPASPPPSPRTGGAEKPANATRVSRDTPPRCELPPWDSSLRPGGGELHLDRLQLERRSNQAFWIGIEVTLRPLGQAGDNQAMCPERA